VYDDFVTERERYRENYMRRAGETLALARAWIEKHRSGPFFCFIHLIDPHGPYTPPGAFATRFRSTVEDPVQGEIPLYQQIPGVRDRNRYRDLYDGAIAYASSELGHFFASLDAAGLWAPSLVVFNSDHGEEMGEHGFNFAHGCDLFEQNVHIPLIVKLPAGMAAPRGARTTAPVSVVDLLPTVLELLGEPRPAALQGRSLVPLLTGESPGDGAAPRSVFFELHEEHPLAGEVRGGRKTLLAGGLLEQYDLAADPAERHPLPPAQLDASAEQALREWQRASEAWPRFFQVEWNNMAYARRGAFVRGRSRAIDGDVQRLRSLGYL
jgi:arylsulfatase A-like enzyme